MAATESQNPHGELNVEAMGKAQQRERLLLIRTYLAVALAAIITVFITDLFGLPDISTLFSTLLSAAVYAVMLWFASYERLPLITTIAGLTSGAGIILGLHLTGGFSGPTIPLISVTVIAFLVLFEGNRFIYATTLLFIAYVALILVEKTGWLPAIHSLTPDQADLLAAFNTILSLVVGSAFLFWYVTRYINTTRNTIVQAQRLELLNQQLLVQQKLQRQTASDVSIAAQRIGEATNVQAIAAQEQAATVVQVSSSAEQLDMEAQLIAGSARQVSELAGQASDEVNASKQLITSVESSVRLVHGDVALAVERTTQLSEHVREIGTILRLLESITKETHILSLNAAIEAAAAEDTNVGRRFTVVAQEVEELAGRAERATFQVRTIIAQVEQAANSTAIATTESLAETGRSVELLQQATMTAQKLSAMAADVNIWADSIVQSTEQQRSSSDQVASALRQISSLAQQNANSEQQLHAVADQLATLVARLQQNAPSLQDDVSTSLSSGSTSHPAPTLVPNVAQKATSLVGRLLNVASN